MSSSSFALNQTDTLLLLRLYVNIILGYFYSTGYVTPI